ncbi:leucyl aminopeptidase family protein [Inhella gelatinilytica]|uniref:Leucyl aminopeptidase family protein n=1 Tax=Inhella gelatinilytica TaxID=2795030 RepID=A0A931J1H1_9BURK|nr:leucyl aminopeptidase family protein [Inhella gelatinilytica]MBH9553621.1 leucyl aminopeptidase family protein [Inhella gelatinilytica]
MTLTLAKKVPASATPLLCSTVEAWPEIRKGLPVATQRWLDAVGFAAKPDTHVVLPDEQGRLSCVVVGVRASDDPYALAAFPQILPTGRYKLDADGVALDPQAAALSWVLGDYVFDAYKARGRVSAELVLPDGPESQRGLALATALCATRDLVNTPAEHMGPAQLAEAVKLVGKPHGAKVKEIVGDALLKNNFPAIHAVGRAAAPDRAPRLIELTWGNPKHPKLSLVGKGVCFDSGGLDIKPADGMRLMKKDMGGAANALGLAALVMALKLPVRLQLLIPAVENAISGNAFRPGDVFRTRKGLTIEIGNTDAEGRVVLCDAMAYACESKPELLIDLATLTGAARVALGPELPALFTRDMALGRELVDLGLQERDPLWHMPLWQPYQALIETPMADVSNSGSSPMAGAVTAALFLDRFVPADQAWLHIDLFAWTTLARPGRPVGGEAQTLRTLIHFLERRFAG